METLEYIGLDTSHVRAQYAKVRAALERDDFRQAEVKKLANINHGRYYRARLDHTNRLLFSIIRHGDTRYALILDVIDHHAYDKCRFLRGAEVQDDRIPAIDVAEAAAEATSVRYIHPARREIHLLDKVISFDDAQQSVYALPAPLIVVGSAGSGKTARARRAGGRMAGFLELVLPSTANVSRHRRPSRARGDSRCHYCRAYRPVAA